MMLLPIPPKYRCSWLAPEKCWLVPIGSGFSALSDSYVGMYRRDAARMPGGAILGDPVAQQVTTGAAAQAQAEAFQIRVPADFITAPLRQDEAWNGLRIQFQLHGAISSGKHRGSSFCFLVRLKLTENTLKSPEKTSPAVSCPLLLPC